MSAHINLVCPVPSALGTTTGWGGREEEDQNGMCCQAPCLVLLLMYYKPPPSSPPLHMYVLPFTVSLRTLTPALVPVFSALYPVAQCLRAQAQPHCQLCKHGQVISSFCASVSSCVKMWITTVPVLADIKHLDLSLVHSKCSEVLAVVNLLPLPLLHQLPCCYNRCPLDS